MTTVPPIPSPSGISPGVTGGEDSAAPTARRGASFAGILDTIQNANQTPHPPASARPQAVTAPPADDFRPSRPHPGVAPGQVRPGRQTLPSSRISRVLSNIQQGQARLDTIITRLRTMDDFSPRELITLQAELHQLTLTLETTTKMIAEAVTAARTLLHQQV